MEVMYHDKLVSNEKNHKFKESKLRNASLSIIHQ